MPTAPRTIRAQAITSFSASPCALSLQWQADGDAAGDFFGFYVDGNADFDGDGKRDLLVGAPGHTAPGATAPPMLSMSSGSSTSPSAAVTRRWDFVSRVGKSGLS
ncbi:MAG TPA: integrin alpha [bacterium]|nr:integrin alpha [bacterium]